MFAPSSMGIQGSLLDQVEDVGLRPLAGATQRTELSLGAWVEVRPGFITGSDELMARLTLGGSANVDWRSERRVMWEKEVDTPRLLRYYKAQSQWPDPILRDAQRALSEHYFAELGEPFETVGMCLYRDGRDSVAWHGDRIGRSRTHDTMVAIVSIGAPRTLALRPRGGGDSVRFHLGHGDLLVMGGSCQRTWDHCIPKTTQPVGPRISLQFRPHNVH